MLLSRDGYKSDLDQIAQLFERAFKRKVSIDFLKWRYLDNPLQELYVNIATDRERIVANYSASPCYLECGDLVGKSALSMTTMTDPEYTGRGLFQKLADELYEQLHIDGYLGVWGFPNNQSHKTFASKLQWIDIYEIPTMQLPLDNATATVSSQSLIFDNRFLLEYSTPASVKDLVHVAKTQTYLQWRYANNPINRYSNFVIADKNQVSSYCVTKEYNEELDIVDFQVNSKDEGNELVQQVISIAVEKRFKRINCWAPRHHFMHGLLERHGFFNGLPLTYLGFRKFNDNYLTDNYSQWFLQMGDSDVY